MHGGLHHLHARKRLYKHLSPYPHPTTWKRWYDYIMYGVAIGSPVSLLPQVFQLFTTHDASGLSLTTWVLANVINTLWLVYGIIHRTLPLIISGLIFVFLNASMVYGIIAFGRF